MAGFPCINRPRMGDELQIADCRMQIDDERRATGAFNLQSAFCNLQSAICNLHSAFCNPTNDPNHRPTALS
jgi:hypothetical protein